MKGDKNMSNNEKNFKNDQEEVVGVNTPEDQEDGFFSEETNAEEEPSGAEVPPAAPKKEEEPKKGFFEKGIFDWFRKHWKLALSLGLVSVVGGVVFVYWMGKKPVKLGRVDEVARDLGNEADVIDFVEAAKELVKKDEVKEAVNG